MFFGGVIEGLRNRGGEDVLIEIGLTATILCNRLRKHRASSRKWFNTVLERSSKLMQGTDVMGAMSIS